MSDYRIVQCFGTLHRPRKADRPCGRRFLWIAQGKSGNFGKKGTQACPHCGTSPDFRHPINRALNGEITIQEAEKIMFPENNS